MGPTRPQRILSTGSGWVVLIGPTLDCGAGASLLFLSRRPHIWGVFRHFSGIQGDFWGYHKKCAHTFRVVPLLSFLVPF